MSFRHLKSTVAIPCLAATVAASIASGFVMQSSSASLEMIRTSETEGEVAFRGSGRFEHKDSVAYRASGRLHAGVNRYVAPYRGSERGVDAVAYRASGRFSSAPLDSSLSAEAREQRNPAVAYRASGRFESGLEQDVISYRGSERGIELQA